MGGYSLRAESASTIENPIRFGQEGAEMTEGVQSAITSVSFPKTLDELRRMGIKLLGLIGRGSELALILKDVVPINRGDGPF